MGEVWVTSSGLIVANNGDVADCGNEAADYVYNCLQHRINKYCFESTVHEAHWKVLQHVYALWPGLVPQMTHAEFTRAHHEMITNGAKPFKTEKDRVWPDACNDIWDLYVDIFTNILMHHTPAPKRYVPTAVPPTGMEIAVCVAIMDVAGFTCALNHRRKPEAFATYFDDRAHDFLAYLRSFANGEWFDAIQNDFLARVCSVQSDILHLHAIRVGARVAVLHPGRTTKGLYDEKFEAAKKWAASCGLVSLEVEVVGGGKAAKDKYGAAD